MTNPAFDLIKAKDEIQMNPNSGWVSVPVYEDEDIFQQNQPDRQKQQRKRIQRERQRQAYIRELRRKRQKRKLIIVFILFLFSCVLLGWTISLSVGKKAVAKNVSFYEGELTLSEIDAEKPDWTIDYLTLNEYSRPGEALTEVKNIFVHYTANPGTSAKQNRSYFEQLKDTQERSASAHFIIGYEGEIIQCIPFDEIGYAVQTRNYDSISIECCYLNKDGSFTQKTYDSLIKLVVYLLDKYNLNAEDVLRHYDCGGKKCPLYYVNNPDEWDKLKEDIAKKHGE